MTIKWTEETKKLKDLKPFESNPRTISADSFKRLKEKLSVSGYHQRIRVTHDNRIIGGHQRIKALEELGYKEIEVLVPDTELTDAQYKREVIQDNIQDGEWDIDILVADFEPFELADYGLDLEALGIDFQDPTILDEMPGLPDGDREPFQQMTFTVHDDQKEVIDEALKMAKDLGQGFEESPNENSNGNAISLICELFINDARNKKVS